MSSTAITTLIKMIEILPETTQTQVVEHLREYLSDLQDEIQWEDTFGKTQKKLVAVARKAKQQIASGQARPLDYSQL